jgi:hypothetical protein
MEYIMNKDKKKPIHYVDNKEFLEEMISYRTKYLLYKDNHDLSKSDKPVISEKAAICFIKIAEHLATKPNFRNYTYKDEMILDGIENCIAYAHNFNPEKSTNPFSYFTQIIYYAFIRRIQKEQKQTEIKKGIIHRSDISQLFDIDVSDDNTELRKYYDTILENYFK